MTTYLTDKADLYFGTNLNDQVSGKKGNDWLFGEFGNDWLYGDDGDDTLSGGFGVDLLFGGSGSDTANYGYYKSGVIASLAKGFGHIKTYEKAYDADFYFSIENITGSDFDDNLEGDNIANVLKGGAGSDVLSGLGGNDSLYGGFGNDTLTGGAGADYLDGGSNTDTVSYQDAASGIVANLTTGGTAGEAVGDVYVSIEYVRGSQFGDSLGGNSSDNRIDGNSGHDQLYGFAGNDTLFGGDGNDTLYGGIGDDNFNGGTGNDVIYADIGNDTLSYSGSAAAVSVNLTSGGATGGDATGDIFQGIESVVGSDFDDKLTGDANTNYLYGQAGADTINTADGDDWAYGGDGKDSIKTGNGNDQLYGGAGTDVLDGGVGADTFYFQNLDTSRIAADVITLFQSALDKIDLHLLDAKASTAAIDNFVFIGTANYGLGMAGQLRYEKVGANTFVEGDVNGDAKADFSIQLTGFAGIMTTSDFLL